MYPASDWSVFRGSSCYDDFDLPREEISSISGQFGSDKEPPRMESSNKLERLARLDHRFVEISRKLGRKWWSSRRKQRLS
jgi:hypothetical protein